MSTWLAQITRSKTGQAAFRTRPSYHAHLVRNQDLSEEVWLDIWNTRPGVKMAFEMLDYDIGPARAAAVLRREKRRTVVTQLVRHTRISAEQGEKLLNADLVSAEAATAWWCAGTVPDSLRLRVARLSGPETRYKYVAETEGLSESEALDLIGRPGSWMSENLWKVMEARPDLLPAFLASDSFQLRAAACSSRHLFDQDAMIAALSHEECWRMTFGSQFPMLALARNPNAGPAVMQAILDLKDRDGGIGNLGADAAKSRLRDPRFVTHAWEDVESEDELALLALYAPVNEVRRSFVAGLPRASNVPKFNRPAWAPQRSGRTAANAPVEWSVEDVLAADLAPTARTPQTLLAACAVVIDRELDATGSDAWDVAVALLDGGFSGTLGELLNVCRNV